MKRLFAIFLMLTLLTGLWACGADTTSDDSESKPETQAETQPTQPSTAPTEPVPSGLQVGFGRESITPDYEVNMAGSASNRVSSGYLDLLYLTCVALRENDETYLVCTTDLVECNPVWVNPTKAVMSQETGVPESNILICSTHTHSSVSIGSDSCKNVDRYRKEFFDAARLAAKAAVEDLAPAEVWYGDIWAENMAWVRHYELSNGTYAGANFGDFSSGQIVGHASDADCELQLIKFARPDKEKKDVVLINFPAHATMNSSEPSLSADFPAPTRSYIEENSDSLVAYFIAAAGNQVPSSRIETETFSKDYNVYGAELGRYAVQCMDNNLTQVESTGIILNKHTYLGKSNRAGLDRLNEALAVQMIWNQVGGRGTTEGKNAAKQAGFSSVYEVTSILNRAGAPEDRAMDIHALSVGDVSFVFAPYEMFGTQGMYIKENSPYPMTFIITCCEDDGGYMPSELGWELGTYESQISRFERGTAEKLADTYVEMLTAMKNS